MAPTVMASETIALFTRYRAKWPCVHASWSVSSVRSTGRSARG